MTEQVFCTCPLAEVAKVSVHPRQRGLVQGRSLLDNLVEVEGFAQCYATASAENPAIVLFDIKTAFPSLAHHWLFVALRRMGIPTLICVAIKSLYRAGFAAISLGGTRGVSHQTIGWNPSGVPCLGHPFRSCR